MELTRNTRNRMHNGVTAAEVRGMSAAPILVHGAGLMDVFADHRSQERVGK